jgi:hypothetical protein
MSRKNPVLAVLATLLLVGSVIVGIALLPGSGASAHPNNCHRHHNCPSSTPTHPNNCHRHHNCPSSTPTSAPTSPSSAPTSPSSVPTSPSSSATGGGGPFSCHVAIGGNCGPYSYAGIPMSNGYNTYVSNQGIDVHGSATVNANNPGDWNVVANLFDCGGCVQIYPHVQQLTNNWNGSGWGGGSQDTPWRTLSTLKINYDETSPQTGASYQFSPDVWGPGPWDIMFWVDTHGRCNEGAFGPVVLGHLTIDGQAWTAHQYGNEIILVLDGAGGPGTCAQQSSGTINILAGLNWLYDRGFISGTTLQQLNTGWEITQSSGQTFTMNSYSVTAK